MLARALLANPGSSLAYSDVRIADSSGAILSETYWFERRNSFASMASMMIANNVTGAASMFRRELLGPALPFPPGGTGQELYHDHWLALCALASGPLTYLDRPTHDYTRHEASVTVLETEGSWVVAAAGPPRGAADALAALQPAGSGCLARGPGWRSVYFGRYLLIRQLATILELRIGRDAIPQRHRRDLDRLLAAERSPAGRRLAAGPVLPPLGRPQRDARPRAGGFRRDPLAELIGRLGPAAGSIEPAVSEVGGPDLGRVALLRPRPPSRRARRGWRT